MNDQLDSLGTQVVELTTRVDAMSTQWEAELRGEKQRHVSFSLHFVMELILPHFRRNDELSRILERVVEIGLRGGWAEFQDTPLQIPRIKLPPPRLLDESVPRASQDTQIDIDTRNRHSESPPHSKPPPSSSS